jgi:hypothetical protein
MEKTVSFLGAKQRGKPQSHKTKGYGNCRGATRRKMTKAEREPPLSATSGHNPAFLAGTPAP